MRPDFNLGYHLAPAPDAFLHLAFSRRLSLIVPPPTIRSQRRIAKIRLMRMQEELSHPYDSIPEPITSEIEVGGIE